MKFFWVLMGLITANVIMALLGGSWASAVERSVFQLAAVVACAFVAGRMQ